MGVYGEPVVWSQYDEDLALRYRTSSRNQTGETFQYSQTLDPNFKVETFRVWRQIERYHGLWYIRFRHTDPEIARDVVRFGQTRVSRLFSGSGRRENRSFVFVDQVTEANLPEKPTYYKTGVLVLSER